MVEYKVSTNNMKEELSLLWGSCFNDKPKAVECFFNNRFKAENCVVCTVNGRVVSAIHMLPAKLIYNKKESDACYWYAVATLPEFRKKGYMKNLSEFANIKAKQKGQEFSFLLPANQGLYSYYKKMGYNTFFKSRFVKVSQEEMKKYSFKSRCNNVKISLKAMYKLRLRIYNNIKTSIRWDIEAIDYAVRVNKIYGGSTVFTKNGYAICSINDDRLVEVTDLVVDEDNFEELMCTIYNEFPNSSFRFRLPCESPIFKNRGSILDFGMIKQTDCNNILNSDGDVGFPYIGLTLD